ncbi:FtsX-like permease family protein [[Pseudomonas] boreopolis]|uniref:FtsX-like permease family protein n=1 Tax=Xanthomonas boreopolis TaxID=86183 RepID=UPI003D9B87CD
MRQISIYKEFIRTLLLIIQTDIHRPTLSLIIFLGFTVCSTTIITLLSIPTGIDDIASTTGLPNVTLALSKSSSDEASSKLSNDEINLIKNLDGISKDEHGNPQVAAQFIASANVSSTGYSTRTLIRGVTQETISILKKNGINFPNENIEPRDILAGDQLYGNGLREPILIRNKKFETVYRLAVPGSLWESEVWGEMSTIMALYNTNSQASLLWILTTKDNSADHLQRLADKDPRLANIRFIGQKAYYKHQIDKISDIIKNAAYLISLLMGLASAITIYASASLAIEGKSDAIRIWRAMGFSTEIILLSIFTELILIGFASSLTTSILAVILLDGRSFGTSTFDQAIYAHFSISWEVCAATIFYCSLIAIIGGLLPATLIQKDAFCGTSNR